MHSKAASSSSLSSSSTSGSKRKWTRQQLLKNLAILSSLDDPLPSALPPSPPASRSTSPVPGIKRRSETIAVQDHAKRPRTGSFPNNNHSSQSSSSLPPAPSPVIQLRVSGSTPSQRPEPCEDGEVREDLVSTSRTAAPASNSVISNVPVRRPKRGLPSTRHFDYLHDYYHGAGRKLKYSGDARFWSTFPPTHKEYRPLANPPPSSSPYHLHGGLIAKIELVHALVCFTYSLWSKDFKQRSCSKDTWKTIEGFLQWCRSKWQVQDNMPEAEKAFFGLICMIESFIHMRKAVYFSRVLDVEMDTVSEKARDRISEAIVLADQKISDTSLALLGVKAEATPQMLPSPASIAPANSANSTPTNRDDGSTPSTKSDRSSTASETVKPGPPIPGRLLPSNYSSTSGHSIPSHINAVANTVTVPIGPQLIGGLKDLTATLKAGASATNQTQLHLNLPMMARCFPRTFSRMIHSSLAPAEEYEPDLDDDECELLWPGQSLQGEGLGWVCLMGHAMIKEFGHSYGYNGLKGVVPKPEVSEEATNGQPVQRHGLPQRPNSTPHGSTPHGSTPQPYLSAQR
ncbi:hypothetical protein C8J56DRAFT_436736 [Mycena floridula]|nr:hypothetical protein C8J56DRAFT_436736 [Mycena floridula]